uniref:Transcription factor TFIIB cyclin-like domain-containing protein n=1 Tax=viral metagenome TaxID=1070528 RepID=A0A6C0BMB4_9ZZZZ
MTDLSIQDPAINPIEEDKPKKKIKNPEKSIRSFLEDLQLPDDVKNEAESIYSRLHISQRKRKKRLLVVYYCLYNAYKVLGLSYVPNLLADMVGIDRKDISKAISSCFPLQSGYYPPQVQRNPRDFIPQCIEVLNLDLMLADEVIDLYNQVMKSEKSRLLAEKAPQSVAAGMIMYFSSTRGFIVDKEQFSKLIGVSEFTLDTITKLIIHVHNT